MLPQGVRILVIDDDPALLDIIIRMLTRVGAAPIGAETGTAGLAALTRETYDLLILDLMLPDIDGFDILERLRKDPDYDAMPILILSALVNPDMISKGLKMGADAYITKPYLPNTLTDRVRVLLEQGRRPPPTPPRSPTDAASEQDTGQDEQEHD
jgi:DNA-binding response OmpR family regulator